MSVKMSISDTVLAETLEEAEAAEDAGLAVACRVALGWALPAANGFITTQDAIDVVARHLQLLDLQATQPRPRAARHLEETP